MSGLFSLRFSSQMFLHDGVRGFYKGLIQDKNGIIIIIKIFEFVAYINEVWRANFVLRHWPYLIKKQQTLALRKWWVFAKNSLRKIRMQNKHTSTLKAFHVKAWTIWLEILGPCFHGSGIQFTGLFPKYVIEALTYPFPLAGDNAHWELLKDVSFESHTRYANFCLP